MPARLLHPGRRSPRPFLLPARRAVPNGRADCGKGDWLAVKRYRKLARRAAIAPGRGHDIGRKAAAKVGLECPQP